MVKIRLLRRHAQPIFFYSVFLLFQATRLQNTLNEHFGFRQTQTAMGIRSAATSGISFLHLKIPVLGPPYEIPMEFPLFQNLAGAISRFSGTASSTAGRFLSLLSFTLMIMVVCRVIFICTNRDTSKIALPILLFNPFSLKWAQACLIESFTLLLLFLAVLLIIHPGDLGIHIRILIPVCLILGALSKVTTAMLFPLLSILLLLSTPLETRDKTDRIKLLVGAWILSFGSAYLWTHLADEIKKKGSFTEFLTSSNLKAWNFGTVEQRFDVTNWITFAHRLEFFTGSIFLLFVAFLVEIRSEKKVALAWASQIAIGLVLFTNLYRVHEYYFFTLLAPSVALISMLITGLTNRAKPARRKLSTYLLLFAVVMMSWSSPYVVREKSVFYPNAKNELSKELTKFTNMSDSIVLLGCDWDPTTFYYANRSGLALPTKFLSLDRQLIEKIESEFGSGYFKYIAFCGEPISITEAPLEKVQGSSSIYLFPN